MRKLYRKRDIFLLTLGGIGDTIEDVRDPFRMVSNAYENMYGFIPGQYSRHNFSQLVSRNLKTGYIEKVVKNGKSYLRLTSLGKEQIKRDFPITVLTKTWNKKWIIVIFDIEEKTRSERNKLRNMLKNIGFGILQDSAWISPLPIGQDVKEFIVSQGFSDKAFVLEVSTVLLGDPRVLASRVWKLEKRENEYLKLKGDIKKIADDIKACDGRQNKRDGDVEKGLRNQQNRRSQQYLQSLRNQLRSEKNKMLKFLMMLPPLPPELFPNTLRKSIVT